MTIKKKKKMIKQKLKMKKAGIFMKLTIGFDLGASRVKVSFINSENELCTVIFPNRIDPNATMAKSGVKVMFNGNACRIGAISGYSNLQVKKVNYDKLPEILFTAVNYITQQVGETDLELEINTVLPPQQFMESKKEFKKLLIGLDGESAVVDGKTITLKISKVRVGCEGVALLKTLDLQNLGDQASQLLLLDVGSSTTDIIILSEENQIYNVEDALTFPKGGKVMCKEIATYLNNMHIGTTFDADKLERQMRYQLDGQNYDLTECQQAYDGFVSELLAFLNGSIGNIRLYKVILAGGGSRLLKHNQKFQDVVKGFVVVPDEFLDFGNSTGILL
ncbi:MAG: hypothetical protein ATN33_00810 [Epulopiscium sp. Nele67-Bin001]|nr:MAG: hypothetical protein ATN33_00810 [Epulopiscium sp. Nele67-Bin001]